MSPDQSKICEKSFPPKRKLGRAFIKNRSGATVIEFAMLAFPFMLLDRKSVV